MVPACVCLGHVPALRALSQRPDGGCDRPVLCFLAGQAVRSGLPGAVSPQALGRPGTNRGCGDQSLVFI